MNEDKVKNLKKMVIISSIVSSPFFLGFISVFIAVFFVLGLFDVETQAGQGSGIVSGTQITNEICSSITVEGIGSMSLDEYVAGVVGGEVGLFTGHPEIQKALSIAARSYGLEGATKDGNGNCTVPNGEGFQVYKASAVNDTILDIVEETKGMILVDENGNVRSAEYDSILIVNSYDSSGDTVTLKQRNLKIPKSWLIEVREPYVSCPINSNDGKSLNKLRSSYSGYGCGHGRGMSQWGGLYLEMEKGYNYIEILDYFYGKESGYNYSLATTNSIINSGTSSNNGKLPELTEYNIGRQGLKVLNRTLTSNEINELNNYINGQVNQAGYGTGAGVAAAGQSLVYWLAEKGYYLQYWYGGGQCCGDSNNTFVGVNPNWGSTKFGSDPGTGKNGSYFGMDCSGFVSWTVRTACNSNLGSRTAKTWMSLPYVKEISSLKEAKPGDLIGSQGHVILIVKNNGDGSVITAEEGGQYGNLHFNKISKVKSDSKILDMSGWYNNKCSNG